MDVELISLCMRESSGENEDSLLLLLIGTKADGGEINRGSRMQVRPTARRRQSPSV